MNKTKIDDSIIKMYQIEKKSIHSIGASLGIHPRTVHQHLMDLGIPRRKRGVAHWSEEQKKFRKDWNLAHRKSMNCRGWHHSEKTKKEMSSQRAGSKNANWKGGVTEGIRLFRKSRRYQQWRCAILKRDGYKCSICRCAANVAHHIKSIKESPELRFEVDNGLTLCTVHHNSLHRPKKVIHH